MPIINVTDLVGKYTVAKNTFNTVALQQLCNDVVAEYMGRIFGADLANLILADIGGGNVPTDPDYLTLWNELRYEINNDNYYSAGMQKALLSFCYYRCVYAQITNPTIYGAVNSSLENSTQSVDGMPPTVNAIYNEGVRYVNAVQAYAQDNRDVYPKFNGQVILFNFR
jgi:hypothetical protein